MFVFLLVVLVFALFLLRVGEGKSFWFVKWGFAGALFLFSPVLAVVTVGLAMVLPMFLLFKAA